MLKEQIKSGKAPMNLPFSQGIRFGELVFVSGQGPMDESGIVIPGDIKAQTRRTLENFQKVVLAAGSDMKYVLQTTVYLADLGDYAGMNEVYASFFPDPKPARATVQANLLFGMRVEVQGVASRGEH